MIVIVKNPNGLTTETGFAKAGQSIEIRNATALQHLLSAGQVEFPKAPSPKPAKEERGK